MDEFNNPFNEDKPDTNSQPDPYNQQDPYNRGSQNPDPSYNQQNPYAQGGQTADPYNQQPQGNPYNQQAQGNPYNQQPQGNPYNQQAQGNPYNQQPQGNPYNQQPQGNPYNQQAGQNPYAMPPRGVPYNQPVQSPYAAYGQQAYYPQNQSTGMAVASLVLGILSILLALFVFSAPFLLLLPIIGIILGIVYKSKHLPVGKGLSTAGIITSICGLVLPIAILIIFVVLMMNHALDGIMAEALKQLKQTNPDLYQQYYDLFKDTFPEWFEGILFIFVLK